MDITLTIPLVCFVVGIVFGVINNEFRNSTFWFWLTLLLVVAINLRAHP